MMYKARLTAKGCHQREGLDFNDTFSPVARLSTIRLILALSVQQKFQLWQFDVESAFPNAKLPQDVEIYMHPPEFLNLPQGTFLRLQRALYGLNRHHENGSNILQQFSNHLD